MSTLLSINNYHYYRGGADSLFLEQNQLFRDLGWTVVPFAMKHPKNLPSEWSKYFVDEIEFGQGYTFRGRLVRAAKVIYSLESRRRLASLMDATHPDICHAHNIYHHISPSILGLLKRRGVPVVLTLHDLKIACPAYNMLANDGICERCKGGRLYNVVTHRCIKGSTALSTIILAEAVLYRLLGSYRNCVSRLVVPSMFYMRKLIEWGYPAGMFSHIPNFVRTERYLPHFSPGKAVIFFGRVSREKGLATLIHAAAVSRSRIMIVGTGPDELHLRELADRSGAQIDFLGYLTGDRLHDAIRSARAVVLPSEWYENAPMSILEAYALGKPVIGARIGGIPELVRDNYSGASFESGNVESLAEALNAINALPDPQIEDMGRNARRWVESDFTADQYQQRICTLYHQLGVTIPLRPSAHAFASSLRQH